MPLNHPRGRSLDSWFILQQKLRSIKIEASCWVLKFHYHTSPYYRYLFSIHMRPLGRDDLPWYLYSEYSVTCLPRFHLFLGENFPFLCAVEYVSKLPKRSGILLLNSDDHLFASYNVFWKGWKFILALSLFVPWELWGISEGFFYAVFFPVS